MLARPKKRQRTGSSLDRPDVKTLLDFFPKSTAMAFDADECRELQLDTKGREQLLLSTKRNDANGVQGTIQTTDTSAELTDAESHPESATLADTLPRTLPDCSPIKEELDDIDAFEAMESKDDEVFDEEFQDEEMQCPENDDIDDDFNDHSKLTRAVSGHDGLLCPFCNLSFSGLSEDVYLWNVILIKS